MAAEILPLYTRVTSMSFAYSMTLAPAYCVMLYGAVGLAIVWPMRATNTRSLDEQEDPWLT